MRRSQAGQLIFLKLKQNIWLKQMVAFKFVYNVWTMVQTNNILDNFYLKLGIKRIKLKSSISIYQNKHYLSLTKLL